MKLNSVLARLKAHQIEVQKDETDSDGRRIIIVGCTAPSPPFALGRVCYYTLVLSSGQEDVDLQEREAMRRRLWHSTTDIFGDDEAGLTSLEDEDISDFLKNAPKAPDEFTP